MRDLPHRAIVLKAMQSSVLSPHSVILFDRELGKINAKVKLRDQQSRAFMQGGLIMYEVFLSRERYCITDVELLELPHSWACNDLLFLHHVLEMGQFHVAAIRACAKIVFVRERANLADAQVNTEIRS